MQDPTTQDLEFLKRVNEIIEAQIRNEAFGVSELADAMNMSRSNLLRKIKKSTKLSVSQLINQVRLKTAMELLRKSAMNVSEISHEVGYGSVSYFIKCFREYYGYPPGEVGKRAPAPEAATPTENVIPSGTSQRKYYYVTAALAVVVTIGFAIVYYATRSSSTEVNISKSIAVLPFKNESSDSSNVYLINGLMEATISNLQRIEALKVISRTSTEKYRHTDKSIPEIGQELGVNYFVEGSGQKIGDKILLNIQLIEASTDRHVWANQYRREVKDIFELQEEVARNIATEIQAAITPAEQKKIARQPTKNIEAYELYLKGKDLFYMTSRPNLEEAIGYLNQAIEKDPSFALAYAEATLVYYYLDFFQTTKSYGDKISTYSDKAMLLDPTLTESLIAKGLYFAHKGEHNQAIPYLEKALQLDPNARLVTHFLTEFYFMFVPNSAKYLEYCLLGLKMDGPLGDSAQTAYSYLRIGNAFLEAGFFNEAESYIDQSIALDSANTVSSAVKVFIAYARDGNINRTRQAITEIYQRDTTRIELLNEVGKVNYMMGDYHSAYEYYKRLIDFRENQNLMMLFANEDLTISSILAKTGHTTKAQQYLTQYKSLADRDKTIYHDLLIAAYEVYTGEHDQAIKHLQAFSKEKNIKYWVLMLENDPIVDPIRDRAEFKSAIKTMKDNFWNNKKELEKSLKEKELL